MIFRWICGFYERKHQTSWPFYVQSKGEIVVRERAFMWVNEYSSTWEREGCRCKSRAWNELGVSMVCCLERAACGGVTELWRNQGNEIFLRAFFTIVAGFPAGDVMTVRLPRVQFTCTNAITVFSATNGNKRVVERTSDMLLSLMYFPDSQNGSE